MLEISHQKVPAPVSLLFLLMNFNSINKTASEFMNSNAFQRFHTSIQLRILEDGCSNAQDTNTSVLKKAKILWGSSTGSIH